MLVVFVSLLLNSAILPRMSAAIFSVGAVVAAVGIRWLKDFLFHRESEDESSKIVPAVSFASTTQDAAGSVLVVGGAGYIGSIVTAKLLERGCKVRLLDNLFYGNQAIEPLLSNPNLEFILGDSRNIQDVVRAMSGVSHVIHLAAIVGDPACAEDKANAFQINYAATRMLLEIAKGQGIERFLFASSCSVYGASDSVTDERSETQPISLYAETKLQSEGVLLEARSRSFHPTVLRFATVFGLAPRPRFDLVVNLLTAKAIQDGVITVYNGDQWRPFIHVRDVAAAIVDVFAAPLASVTGEIFNVGDDTLNYTLAQVAEKIREHIPQTRVEYVENADRRNYRVSFKKIRDCIGYTAKLSVDDGILEIKRAFERGVIQNYRQPFYSNVSYLKERGHVEAKTELDVKVMAAFAGAGSRPVATLPQIPRYSPPQPSHMTDDSASRGSSSSSIS
jgi:nucleoside-diphosphate-sugar epimerase